jgi:apolipoprotein N-acyltransferase
LSALIGALASAALFGLAARLEAPSQVAALVALAPWLAAIDRARPRTALLSAGLLAMGVAAAAFWWLPATIAAYAHVSAPVAWICALALAPLVLQPQFLAACASRLFARRLGAPRAVRAAVTAFAYVGAEWALPKLLGDTLGIGLFPSAWLRQAADLAGPRGLTLLCLAVSECVAAAAAVPAMVAVATVALAGLYGAVRLRAIEAAGNGERPLHAGIVQAAITAYDKLAAEQGTYEAVRQIVDAHVALSESLLREGPLDILIWPETVYPTTFGAPKSEEGAEFDREIAALPAGTGVPLVFGAFEAGGGGEHNAAFFLEAGGHVQTYRKSLLFPLSEQVPGWLDFPALRAALPWTGRWTPGPGPRVVELHVRGGGVVRFAPLICYEAIYTGYVARAARQGADVLLTISNDAWFADAAAPRLHLAAAALRSVETRLPQIRATNSGISALVLPSGEIVAATRFGTRTAVRLQVPRVPRRWSPVLAWGDWLGPAALAASALLALYLAAPRLRARFSAYLKTRWAAADSSSQ